VEEPSDFNANREVEILGEDYGTVTFDLSDETVCIGDKYYSLTEISHDALVMLHRALYDNFYGVEG
jgi:hypothetical protein